MEILTEQKLDDYRDILLGKKIGSGAYRNVFECRLNKKYVVKVENERGGFANVREYKLWEEVEYSDFEKWFAPCISISQTGLILIQEKVIHRETLPKEVPYFFTDVKPENFGWIGDKFVCCDYGSILYQRTWSNKKMRNPKWEDFFTDNKVI